jgi:hypothetical protein
MAIREPRVRPRRGQPAARRGTLYRSTASPRGTAPPPPQPPDWRSEIVGLSGLNVIAAIWLIIAPWVLAYSGSDPRWNDVVFGIIVGIFALTRATGAYREDWLSGLNAVIGVWLFVAAFTIDHTNVASWNDIILGIIVFLLAIGSAEATANAFRRRRGARPSTP